MFDAIGEGGIAETWDWTELDNDAAALVYAEAVLKEHPSAARVSVFEGVRQVGETSNVRNVGPDAPLHGCSVLVAEDHFLLAEDLRRLLQEAGAQVVGPFAAASSAIAAAERWKPTCALVDINLGEGPNFAAAEALLAMGVPVLFVTGYEAEILPDALSHLPHLRKPACKEEILAAVEAVCSEAIPSC